MVAPFEIKTSGTDGYYIVIDLIDFDSSNMGVEEEYKAAKTQFAFYVRGGERMECHIPLGTYEVYYATGKTWYGEKHLFGFDTIYKKCDETFYFYEDEDGYNGWTISLQSVVNGNLTTETIGKNEFPMP